MHASLSLAHICSVFIMQTKHFLTLFNSCCIFLSPLLSIYLPHSHTHTFITTEGPVDLAALRRLLNQRTSFLLPFTAKARYILPEPALRESDVPECTSCTCFTLGAWHDKTYTHMNGSTCSIHFSWLGIDTIAGRTVTSFTIYDSQYFSSGFIVKTMTFLFNGIYY